jgi:hypothetical protein
MKKWIALVLVFLLSAMSVAAAEEIDFSSYTEAELRELHTQISNEILNHCSENAQSVCDAFIQYMQELGHTLEYDPEHDQDGRFFYLLDGDQEITFFLGLYLVTLQEEFVANNEAYARDCLVALAMAVAQVEGVEIFSNDISKAMYFCKDTIPDGFYKSEDNINILWDKAYKYGYLWYIRNCDGITYVCVY